jgi:DNA uptake protein ComE-like DNA-binding protein
MLGFDVNELLLKYRYPVLILLVGAVLLSSGIFFIKSGIGLSGTKVEVLGTNIDPSIHQGDGNYTVEISGEVINPGVYKLSAGSRINDLLVAAGGFSGKADRVWADKYLNRAAKMMDGQKVFIPSLGQQSGVVSAKNTGGDQTVSDPIAVTKETLVNINTGSLSELDSLPGIGPVFGQKIIEQRPYSNVSELLSKGVLKQSLYDKVKDLVTIY